MQFIIEHFAGPAAILIGVIVSAFTIRRQMRIQYKSSLRNKSLSYSLYSNSHLRDARIEIESAFGPLFSVLESITNSEIENKAKEFPNIKTSIMTLLAHWENMALSIHCDMADDDVCYEMVSSTLLQHVRVFRNFIDKRRETNPRFYDHLMRLRRDWEDRSIEIKRANILPIFGEMRYSNSKKLQSK